MRSARRLVANIAGSLAQVSREDIIARSIARSIAHFRDADQEYGDRVAAAVTAARKRAT
jgi:catalase